MGVREKKKNKRYQSIIETAKELFVAFGLENVQMQDIAEREGIGIATLFRYFPKKDKLIVAVATNLLEKELLNYQKIVRSSCSAFEKMEMIFDRYIAFNSEDKIPSTKFVEAFESYATIAKEPLENLDEYINIRRQISALVHEIIDQGKEDHSIRSGIDINKTIISFVHSFGLFSRKLTVMDTVSFIESDIPSNEQLLILKNVYLAYIKNEEFF